MRTVKIHKNKRRNRVFGEHVTRMMCGLLSWADGPKYLGAKTWKGVSCKACKRSKEK